MSNVDVNSLVVVLVSSGRSLLKSNASVDASCARTERILAATSKGVDLKAS